MGLPLMVTLLPVQQQEGTRDCGLYGIATAYCNAGVKTPATLTTTKVQCEGCSTWLRCYNVVAMTLITGSTPLVLCIDVI